MPLLHYFPVILLLIAAVVLSIITGKLTFWGAIAGGIVGFVVFAGAGYTGLSMLVAFFITGTLATIWQKEKKIKLKPESDQSVKRNAGQVLANGGIAALAGLVGFLVPSQLRPAELIMAAALSSATADTLSSELGMLYGRRFYNIITLTKDTKGLDGGISLEGTGVGILGSALIGLIYSLGFGWSMAFLFIIIAGTIGNICDSVLGALFERRGYLNNDTVNFLSTLAAGLSILLLFFL